MLRAGIQRSSGGSAAGVSAATAASRRAAAAAPPPSIGMGARAAASQPQRRLFSSREDVIKACRIIEKDPHEFLDKYVAEDVMWTVTEPTGKSTPISGIYKSRKAFAEGALKPLSDKFEGALKLSMVDSVIQERENTDLTKVCLELEGTAKLKSDGSEWKNYYSWVMHFRKERVIVVRAYVDSAAVNTAMK